MNDKDLSALIRMAGEAERLEEQAPLRFEWAKPDRTAREGQFRKMLGGIATLAAAACLGIAVLVWMKPTQTPNLPSGGSITHHETSPMDFVRKPEVLADGGASSADNLASVVLASFSDADDRCSCVQMNAADFKGKLTEVGSLELLRTAMANPCHENPKQVLVIAMQGPRESLPTSAAEAELLFAAVADGATHCGDDSMCFTSSTSPYIPEGVTVLAGSIGYH